MTTSTSEDDLQVFERWLDYQAIDPATLTPEALAEWRAMFKEAVARSQRTRKVGRMKLRKVPNEFRYAVAVRDGADLWLTFWIQRSPKGEFFLFYARGKDSGQPHASYHLDGRFHQKSHDKKVLPPRRFQPLSGVFRGVEHLGGYAGHSAKSVGAICEPTDFNQVFEVAAGVLGSKHGAVIIDLVEPGHEPLRVPGKEVDRRVFTDFVPYVVIRIVRFDQSPTIQPSCSVESPMALRGPDPEDVRKLHAEVNQLVNQRFQLTTVAITVFGVVAAWLIPKQAVQSGTPIGAFVFAGSILLLVLLLVIFLYSRLLTGMLRVISAYLIVTNKSGWEHDWASYKGEGAHIGYTRPQAFVFFVLGVFGLGLPYAIAWINSARPEPMAWNYAVLVAAAVYLILVLSLGVLNLGVSDTRAKGKWNGLGTKRP